MHKNTRIVENHLGVIKQIKPVEAGCPSSTDVLCSIVSAARFETLPDSGPEFQISEIFWKHTCMLYYVVQGLCIWQI